MIISQYYPCSYECTEYGTAIALLKNKLIKQQVDKHHSKECYDFLNLQNNHYIKHK